MSPDALQWGAIVLLVVVVVLLAAFLVALLRAYGQLVRTLHDLGIHVDPDASAATGSTPVPLRPGPAATTAEGIVGETLEGGRRAVSVSGGDGPLLLAFLSSGCGTCMGFWRALRTSEDRQLPGIDAPVVVVTKGREKEEPGRLAELASPGLDLVMSDQAWAAYDVPVTPHFVLVDRGSGRVLGEGSAPDPAGLGGLLGRAVADARTVSRRQFLGGGGLGR